MEGRSARLAYLFSPFSGEATANSHSSDTRLGAGYSNVGRELPNADPLGSFRSDLFGHAILGFRRL